MPAVPAVPAATSAVRRLPTVLVAAVAAATLGMTAAGAGAPPVEHRAPSLTAVVALSGDRPVTAPGVELVAMLPSVRAEIVRGARSALATLARSVGVLGVSPDRPVRLQTQAYDGAPIYAPATVGGLSNDNAGEGVTVAVIDTGVSDTAALHRGEGGRLRDGVDTSGLSDPEGGDVTENGRFTDGYGHGTYVASLIAGGAVDESDGPIGVAPAATVDVVKVADDRGRTSLASVVAGLNWVATHADEIDVANLSLSVDRPTDAYGADPLNLAVRLTRAEGVTVVVAAGNTAGEVSDPGFDPAAVTVGAYDTTSGQVADFSGSGDVDGVMKPDVVAAGVHVTGVVPADSVVGRSNSRVARPDGSGNLLIPGTGTSGATAIVSGVAAAFLAHHPDASPADVAASLRAAAVPAGDPRGGAGLVTLPTQQVGGSEPTYPDGWEDTKAAWPDDFWQDDLWTQPWARGSWDTRSWTTRSWTTRSWTTRSWTTRSWTTRSWTTRSWTEGPWSVSGWGTS